MSITPEQHGILRARIGTLVQASISQEAQQYSDPGAYNDARSRVDRAQKSVDSILDFLVAEPASRPCPHGDPLCPCQDGDACHYEGPAAMKPPAKAAARVTVEPVVVGGDPAAHIVRFQVGVQRFQIGDGYWETRDDAEQFAEQFRHALAAMGGAPVPAEVLEGHWLAPMEPDEAMLDKGAMQIAMNHQRVQSAERSAHVVYRAMRDAYIAASPAAPAAPEPVDAAGALRLLRELRNTLWRSYQLSPEGRAYIGKIGAALAAADQQGEQR